MVNGFLTVRGTALWIHLFAGKSCGRSSAASESRIRPRGVYNNRKLIVRRVQGRKYFLDNAICFLTALAGFGTFPRFDTCHLLKPSACQILAFIDPSDDFGGILFCLAASAYIGKQSIVITHVGDMWWWRYRWSIGDVYRAHSTCQKKMLRVVSVSKRRGFLLSLCVAKTFSHQINEGTHPSR